MGKRSAENAGSFWPFVVAVVVVNFPFLAFRAEIAITRPWIGIVFGGLLFGTAASLARLAREGPVQKTVGFGIAYAGLMFGSMVGGDSYLPTVMTIVVGIVVALVLGPVFPKRENVDASPSRLPHS